MSAKMDPLRQYGGTAYNPENTNRLNATTGPLPLGYWSGPPWPKRVLSEEERRSQNWPNSDNLMVDPKPRYETLVKSPQGASAITDAWNSLKTATAEFPDFSEFQKNAQTAGANITQSYNQTPNVSDLGPYAAKMRSLDSLLAGLTTKSGQDYAQIGDRYNRVLSDYEKNLLGSYDAQLAQANRFNDVSIPDAIRMGIANWNAAKSRYDIGANAAGMATGPGTAGATAASRAATTVALPYLLQGQQALMSTMALKPQYLGDITNRYTGKITGYDVPVEQTLYGREANVLGQERATETDLLNRRLQLQQGSFDNAIRYAAANAQSAAQLAAITGLPLQEVMQRAAAIGTLLNLENVALDRYIQKPGGMNVLGPYAHEQSRYTPGVTYNYNFGFPESIGFPESNSAVASAPTLGESPRYAGVARRPLGSPGAYRYPPTTMASPDSGVYGTTATGTGYSMNADGSMNVFTNGRWQTIWPTETQMI